MPSDRFTNPCEFTDTVVFSKPPVLPAASLTSSNQVQAGANLQHTGLQHRDRMRYEEAGGADVANGTHYLGRAYRASTILEAKATPDAVPAGGNKAITIDIKKSTGGGAWASILSNTLVLDGNAVARTSVSLTLANTTLAADDVLEMTATASGTGGTNVQGLALDVVTAENGT